MILHLFVKSRAKPNIRYILSDEFDRIDKYQITTSSYCYMLHCLFDRTLTSNRSSLNNWMAVWKWFCDDLHDSSISITLPYRTVVTNDFYRRLITSVTAKRDNVIYVENPIKSTILILIYLIEIFGNGILVVWIIRFCKPFSSIERFLIHTLNRITLTLIFSAGKLTRNGI